MVQSLSDIFVINIQRFFGGVTIVNDSAIYQSLLKEVINEKIDEFDKEIKEFKCKINMDNSEFKKNIDDKQEKFINYIQSENNSYLHDAKKVENSITHKDEIHHDDEVGIDL